MSGTIKILFRISLAAALASLGTSCGKEAAVAEQRDLKETTDFLDVAESAPMDTYYCPQVGYVGDPMPFYDPVEGDFKIMYLQDFRPNQVGTYHPYWAVSTSDGADYLSLGELIPCGGLSEQDAALGTGSTVYNPADGLYYTFYTGRKHNPSVSENAEAVMVATSPDMRSWTKDRTFILRGGDWGYSRDDFRDPCLFTDPDDGLWHMVISTRKAGKGTLAEFTSPDLKAWSHRGDFMTMLWDRFYECPDIFRMGEWWYLVYSEMHSAIRRVQYFKASTLEGLRGCTAGDVPLWPDDREGYLDSRGFYAGKTASDGSVRYLWGWCPTRSGKDNAKTGAYPAEPEWGGNLVAHTLVQNADGTLVPGPVDAVEKKYRVEEQVVLKETSGDGVSLSDGVLKMEDADSRALFSRLGEHNFIEMEVGCTGRFSISLARGGDSEKWYSIVLNPEDGGAKRKINFVEEGPSGQGYVDGIDSSLFPAAGDDVYRLKLFTDKSVTVLYVNGVCCWTNRIYGVSKNCWSINTYESPLEVRNLAIRSY